MHSLELAGATPCDAVLCRCPRFRLLTLPCKCVSAPTASGPTTAEPVPLCSSSASLPSQEEEEHDDDEEEEGDDDDEPEEEDASCCAAASSVVLISAVSNLRERHLLEPT